MQRCVGEHSGGERKYAYICYYQRVGSRIPYAVEKVSKLFVFLGPRVGIDGYVELFPKKVTQICRIVDLFFGKVVGGSPHAEALSREIHRIGSVMKSHPKLFGVSRRQKKFWHSYPPHPHQYRSVLILLDPEIIRPAGSFRKVSAGFSKRRCKNLRTVFRLPERQQSPIIYCTTYSSKSKDFFVKFFAMRILTTDICAVIMSVKYT